MWSIFALMFEVLKNFTACQLALFRLMTPRMLDLWILFSGCFALFLGFNHFSQLGQLVARVSCPGLILFAEQSRNPFEPVILCRCHHSF